MIPILDLIKAIVLAKTFGFDHGLVRPCMSLDGNQSVQCPVDTDQRFANYASICERLDGFPHALRAGSIIVVCERGEARKLPAIIRVKLADIQTLGDFPCLGAIQVPKRRAILDKVWWKISGLYG